VVLAVCLKTLGCNLKRMVGAIMAAGAAPLPPTGTEGGQAPGGQRLSGCLRATLGRSVLIATFWRWVRGLGVVGRAGAVMPARA
jgi:hypothetical protein